MTLPRRGADPTGHLVVGFISVLILGAACCLQIERGESVQMLGMITLPELCWLRRFAGMACPGCGLTRSFISLAQGRLQEAWDFNPAGPLFFALIVCQIPYRAWQVWRIRSGQPPFSWPFWQWVPLSLVLTVLFGQWLCRAVLEAVVSTIDFS